MPKIVDFDAKRREIASKAVALLVRDGIQETNLGKVAESCGMGRTSMYEYFRNIGELIDFTLEETFTQMREGFKALLQNRNDSAAEQIVNLMQYLETFAVREKERMVLVLDFLFHPDRVTPGVSFDVQAQVRLLRAELERLLVASVKSGEICPVNTSSMAFTLFAFIEAATVHAALYRNVRLDETMGDIRILIDGLKAQAPGNQ